jgi:hypothetical protein
LGKKPKEYFKDRKEEYGKARKLQSQQRVAEGHPSFIKGDHFRSGNLDPMYGFGKTGGKLREAKLAAYGAGGAQSFEEENKQVESSIEAREKGLNERFGTIYATADKYRNENDQKTWTTTKRDEADEDAEGNKVILKSGDKDILAQAIVRGDNGIKFRMVDGQDLSINQMFGHVSDEHKEAALGRLATLGGNPNLTALNDEVMKMMSPKNENNPEVQRRLNRFLGRYASSMFTKMPHWYKGPGGAASGLSPEALAGVSGASMNQMLESLTKTINGGDSEKSEAASKDLATLLRTWGEAVANPNIAGRVDKSAVQRLSDYILPKAEGQPSEIDKVKKSIIDNSGDQVVQADTSKVIEVLKTRVTPTGDIRRLTQQEERAALAQGGAATTQPQQGQQPQGTGGQPQQGQPQGTGGGTGGAGTGGDGTPGRGGEAPIGTPAPGLTTNQMRDAMIQAIEHTGLDQRSEPGVLRVPHSQSPGQVISPTTPTPDAPPPAAGPNIPVTGRTGSGIYIAEDPKNRP